MQSKLKAPGTRRLNLRICELLSNAAFNFNLCRYNWSFMCLLFTLLVLQMQPAKVFEVTSILSSLQPNADRLSTVDDLLGWWDSNCQIVCAWCTSPHLLLLIRLYEPLHRWCLFSMTLPGS